VLPVDITEKRIPQNGRITVLIRGRQVDLRVATLPTVWGEKIVLRVLDTGGIDLDLEKLGFTEYNLGRFAESFTKPHGLLLVTGPTGSGKSTTLYATLGRIGFEGRYDYGGVGNAIILASRLSGEAEPNEILISQRTYAALDGGQAAAEAAGERSLKGFSRPLQVYSVGAAEAAAEAS
jgi:hypothetical protein